MALLSTSYVSAATFQVDYLGTPVEVTYDATGITVNDIIADTEFISLFIEVDVSGSPGILDITFDRNFFDYDEADLFAIADGFDEITPEELETTSETRTLRFELPAGTTDLEIFGTQFGDVTTLSEPEPTPEPTPAPTPEPTPAPTPEPTPAPKTECGPGTVLKDGVCVLDERCGPGTILEDGVCVLVPSEPSVGRGGGFDLVYGAAAGFIIAFIVIIILYIISRGSRQSN